jgi:acyl-CoA thioesterase I
MAVSGLSRGPYGPGAAFRNAAFLLLALASPALAQEEVTIAALGDSLTAGYGLGPGEGFVPQLQAWLDERDAGVTLVNAGVSGDTTRAGLARVEWTLSPEVDAMIVALGGNDLLRGLDPALSRENLRGILEAAEARGVETLLVGVAATPNYGAAYQRDFDAMYVDLADEFNALLEPDWFAALRPEEDAALADAMGRLMQADGIHPSVAGVDLIVERLGPRVLELAEEARAGA